ncbi:MAG TPA: phosphoribosylamine--glycine ligase [Candidatus Limnocylindrales bacterium]|nr:phosphoribosylamine--glycine ligase [Candidatus Limnocylindrales bacterium]
MSLVMPTRILVVGGGGREHALAWKLAAEPGVNEVVVAPGSAAIAAEARVRSLPGVDPTDPAAIVAAARAMAAELVVVGPEAPLATGVADALGEAGIAVFGPTRAAARLETSKAFCHEIAAAAGVRMARARAFGGGEDAVAADFVRELDAAGARIVLKADGLASGKGVIVTDTVEQALELAPSFLLRRPAGTPALVIEERLEGREASVIAVCDGTRAMALPAARDHKRLCDDDRGPNTGGMGAYSPLPDLGDDAVAAVLETIHRPILAELARRGTPFRGFLYAGLMLTRGGPALLECNARLGDPEAQVILPRVAVALGPLLLAAARGRLPDAAAPIVPAMPASAVGIVLAAKGYPGTPRRGDPISGLESAHNAGALVFHAGTVARPGGGYGTNGGRVLTVVGRGPELAAARHAAEAAANLIAWDGLQRRGDIAANLPGPSSGAAAAAAGAVR